MNLFERILEFLSYELPVAPKPYGLFHLTAILLVIVFAVVLSSIGRKRPNHVRGVLAAIIFVLICFEIYKQLVFTYENGSWDYQWYIFPFQFCSVPMYIGLLALFLPKGRFQDACYTFLATFSLFAGLATMLYPNDVFIPTLGISIQTMVHHGGMLVLGIVIIARKKGALKWKNMVGAALVFVGLFVIAFLGNVIVHQFVSETFNMFFVSPYYANHLPVLSTIQAELGYIVFLITYVIGFIGIAYLFLLISRFLKYQVFRRHLRKPITVKG
ncbi:MAG: YwaF family protein [Bacilli bacterium]|jgi:hypothetical protein|nr:YwaF family protein [Bacilli bacterium]MDY0063616.1 YwaF family protein [Bacilli bacterium]